MKFVNGILYIEFQELVSVGVNEGSLKNAKLKGTLSWTFIEDPEDRRRVLVEYEAMKQQYKDLVILKLCGGLDPYSVQATAIIDRQLFSKPTDIEYFDAQQMHDKTRLRAKEACKYLYLLERCRLATWKKDAFPMWSTDEFWKYIIAHIRSNDEFKEKSGINLPTSRARLNHYALQYSEYGPGIVINKRCGNKNASKLGRVVEYKDSGDPVKLTGFDETVFRTQMAVISRLRAHPNNLDIVQLTDNYNKIARESGWLTLTPMRLNMLLREGGREDVITIAERKGKKELRNRISIQERRRAPSQPLYYVTLDGWDVELAYQARVQDRNGNYITRYDNRLVVVIILDPWNKVNYPVGYAIDDTENTDLIKRALKNAVDHIHQVTGEYYAPYQSQSDRYGIKKLTPFYESISHIHIPAAVGNAKAKVIEPYFKYLNKKYCQGEMWLNWTGFGITSRKENQPNFEMKDQIKHSFPDRDGVIAQIEYIISKERELKAKEYFEALEKAPKRLMTRNAYLKALGMPKERTIRATGKGLITDINCVEYAYDTDDLTFRTNLDKNWQVYFDPDDAGSILVEADEGKTQYVLHQKYQPAMAIKDQTPEDVEHRKKITGLNKELDLAIRAASNENYHLTEQHLSQVPELSEYRQKLMFTRNGQQKDPLQEAKGKMLPIEKEKKAIEESTRARKEQDKLAENGSADQDFWERQEKLQASRIDISKYL